MQLIGHGIVIRKELKDVLHSRASFGIIGTLPLSAHCMKKDSWLYSDSFMKRAFAIYGYNLVASLIVAVPIWLIGMLVMATFMSTVQFAP